MDAGDPVKPWHSRTPTRPPTCRNGCTAVVTWASDRIASSVLLVESAESAETGMGPWCRVRCAGPAGGTEPARFAVSCRRALLADEERPPRPHPAAGLPAVG